MSENKERTPFVCPECGQDQFTAYFSARTLISVFTDSAGHFVDYEKLDVPYPDDLELEDNMCRCNECDTEFDLHSLTKLED